MKVPNTGWPLFKAVMAQLFLKLFLFAAAVSGAALLVGALLAIFSVDTPENLLENVFCLSGVSSILCFTIARMFDKETVQTFDL